MPNPSNKQELLAAMADGYAKLNEQMAKMNEEAISRNNMATATPYEFDAVILQNEGICDVLRTIIK